MAGMRIVNWKTAARPCVLYLNTAEGDRIQATTLAGIRRYAAPAFHGGRIARVSADNEAVARAAFRELSAGRPAAYAVVGTCWDVEWAGTRIDTFTALCGEAGMSCHALPFREEPEIGYSVLDEIQLVRLEKAFAFLSGTDTAIGAIADFCGFGSDVELRHVFRARTGKPLRQWRKENGRK